MGTLYISYEAMFNFAGDVPSCRCFKAFFSATAGEDDCNAAAHQGPLQLCVDWFSWIHFDHNLRRIHGFARWNHNARWMERSEPICFILQDLWTWFGHPSPSCGCGAETEFPSISNDFSCNKRFQELIYWIMVWYWYSDRLSMVWECFDLFWPFLDHFSVPSWFGDCFPLSTGWKDSSLLVDSHTSRIPFNSPKNPRFKLKRPKRTLDCSTTQKAGFLFAYRFGCA